MAARRTVLLLLACAPPLAAQSPVPSVPSAPPSPCVEFEDATDASGLGAFHEVNGGPEKNHITGANGGGLALFDCDGDGDLDVFLISGSVLGGPRGPQAPSNRLYRNLGGGRFEDATAAFGLLSNGAFGQGCAVADLNGDGRLDLFVANIGPNALYLSRPDGTFEECAAKAGIAGGGWSSGATFLDGDGDGDLDLYVTRYVTLEPGDIEHGPAHLLFSEWKGQRVFKGPHELTPAADSYYRNNGDGTFTEATREAGMAGAQPSFGFEPLTLDFDGDGDTDLFVANDSMPSFLWRNNGDGTFTDVAFVQGVAVDGNGRPQSNMGVACADYDGDGTPDLFITTFSDDAKTLFQNGRDQWFQDATTKSGLAGAEVYRSLSWGTSLFDVENDGDLDLFVANGHVYPQADQVPGYGYGQRNFLFLNGPNGFENATDRAGPGLQVVAPSRGSAVGDLDDDGDLDIVVNNLDGKPTFLRNRSAPLGHFVRILLRGAPKNRAAIGARLTVVAGGRRQARELRASSSYLSHEDLRTQVGLGAETKVERVEVRWPDGKREVVEAPPCDSLLVIEEGKGLVNATRIGK